MKIVAMIRLATLAIGMSCAMLANAVTNVDPGTTSGPPDAIVAPQANLQAATPSAPTDYRLAGGDSIRITVYQNPDLTLETRVSESGETSYPLIGKVKLGGLTIDAAADEIARRLMQKEIVKNAQVTVSLLQVRGNQVSVLGQVNRPGRILLETAGLRLSDVLAAAGGVINGANASSVNSAGADEAVVVGIRDGKPYRREVDLLSLFMGGHPEDDIVVSGGDTVYVPTARIYYIYGEVQRPGAYRITRGMTVRQALAQAGGPTTRGTERGIHVDRPEGDASRQEVKPAMTDFVQANDVLYVPESLF